MSAAALEGQAQGTPSAAQASAKPSMHALGASTPNTMSMAQNSSQCNNMSQFTMNNSFANSASSGQTTPAATYSPPKQPQFNQSSYQVQHHNIPATQNLPATASSTTTTQPVLPTATASAVDDKPQSNGTAESKSADVCALPSATEKKDKDKDKEKENHVVAGSPQKNNVNASEPVKAAVPLEPAEVPQVTAVSTMPSSTTVTSSTSNASIQAEKPDDKTATDKSAAVKDPEPVTPPLAPASSKLSLDSDKSADKSSTLTAPSTASPDAVAKVNVDSTNVDTSSTSSDTKADDAKTKSDKADKSDKDVAVKVDVVADHKEKESKEKKCDDTKQEAQSTTAEVTSAPTTPQKPKEQSTPSKSPMKLATTPRTPQRKSRTPKSEAESPRSTSKHVVATATVAPPPLPEPKPSTSKSPGGGKTKRSRVRTQPYQSPLPELEILSKMSQHTTTPKSIEKQLIVFYKQEFLAVRNSEGGFFVCQAVQNVYKSSARIRIRWLSQDKNERSGEIYTPDFYDFIDFECILTNLELSKVDKGKFRLPPKEKERTDSILKRAIAVERGEAISLDDSMTEDNPDGLDVSLYTEEDQLTKRQGTKRKLAKGRPPLSSRTPSKREAKVAKTTPTKTPPMKKTPGRKPAAAAATPASEPRKIAAGGRAERAKRRSASELVTETKATKQPVASTSKAKITKTTPPPARKTPKRARK